MMNTIEANWPLVLVAVVLALLVIWWIAVATRRTRVSTERRDTLDDGAAPAARNQALIDAPPVAATAEPVPVPPAPPAGLAGAGVAVAAAVEDRALARNDAPDGDDLTRIKGLGPKLAATLASLGVTRFEQIAAWSDADIERIDAQLGRFQGRIARDNWVEQARLLAAGDREGFEARFGAT
jgi:predicted flap endonuclease-1-like 5' DNA nuclease